MGESSVSREPEWRGNVCSVSHPTQKYSPCCREHQTAQRYAGNNYCYDCFANTFSLLLCFWQIANTFCITHLLLFHWLFLYSSAFHFGDLKLATKQKQVSQSGKLCPVEMLMKFKPYSLLQNFSFQAFFCHVKKASVNTMHGFLACCGYYFAKSILSHHIGRNKS